MKKYLFLDRDGTLILEPSGRWQVNGLEELFLLPKLISSLSKLVQRGYNLVLVSNQDALGTKANPLENYNLVNKKLEEILRSEDICFAAKFVCPHTQEDKCKCRKPKTGMIDAFLEQNDVDFAHSYMVGDRETDMGFAQNIGVQGLLLDERSDWGSICTSILARRAQLERQSKETAIRIELNLDGQGLYKISSGLAFLDHMLEQFSKHSSFDLELKCLGDLNIDEHHSIEDIALSLGSALKMALGDKLGIRRFAWERILVMDEARTELSLDLSGRPFYVQEAVFSTDYVGDFPTEMFTHFMHSFCTSAGINMHLKIIGSNNHHMLESAFKALARCLKEAVYIQNNAVSSTKGIL